MFATNIAVEAKIRTLLNAVCGAWTQEKLSRCERYWYAPSEYRHFSQAAELLQTQLLEAVEGRIELYSKISSDMIIRLKF